MNSPLKFVEEIVWQRVDVAMSDADETVLITSDEIVDHTWLGYHDGESWILVDGMPVFGVTCWAPLPSGPVSL